MGAPSSANVEDGYVLGLWFLNDWGSGNSESSGGGWWILSFMRLHASRRVWFWKKDLCDLSDLQPCWLHHSFAQFLHPYFWSINGPTVIPTAPRIVEEQSGLDHLLSQSGTHEGQSVMSLPEPVLCEKWHGFIMFYNNAKINHLWRKNTLFRVPFPTADLIRI